MKAWDIGVKEHNVDPKYNVHRAPIVAIVVVAKKIVKLELSFSPTTWVLR